MATTNNALGKLLDLAVKFVIDHKGSWEHADWEALLAQVPKTGFEVDDENKRNLGNILEEVGYVKDMLGVCDTGVILKVRLRPNTYVL